MYQDSYPVYIQINSTEAIQAHQALGFDKLIPQKTQTIDEFIEVIDISEDPYSEFEYTNRLLDPENFINQRYKVDDYGLAIGPIIYWVKESWVILIVYTAVLFALFTYITKKFNTNQKSKEDASEFSRSESEMAFSEYTDYHKLEGPIQNVMYNSVKHKSNHKLIDIPLLRLDDRHSSQDSNEFTEKSRAISHSTIYTNNNKTGCIELVKDKKTSKLFSPDNQPTYERCFNRQPFSHMVKTKMKFPNKISTQIMEEDSSSMSPDVSFKKVKSNFVKNQTTRVHKEYLESEDGLFEKVSHETIYHYDKNELVRRVISAEIQSKANEIASQEMDAKYFSFKDERRNPALLPPEERVEITQDFTDSSFNFMNNVTKKSPSKNVNNYLRSGRSKTYKEDDSDYFQVNEAIVNLKKDSMQSPDKSMSKCSAKN